MVYEPRPVKRARSTQAQLAEVRRAIVAAVEADAPVTLRGVFYRVVSMGAVPKTEKAYKQVTRELLKLRRDGAVRYDDITDGSRWTMRAETWSGLDEMLADAAVSYRRALWHDQPVYVEILSEKDAITGVVHRIADQYDVPLGITRGYSSETFTWHTARTIRQKIRDGKQCWIYQMGDHDPSGVDGWRAFRSRVTDFLIDWGITPEDHVTFKRLAVTPAQIETLGLPTRPTKPSDSRSAGFVGESVEVDAIPANRLRAIVKNAILRHIDSRALELQRSAEESERELLTDIRSLVA